MWGWCDSEGAWGKKNSPKRPVPPQNPDEVVPVEEVVKEEVIEAADPKTAAWAVSARASGQPLNSAMSSKKRLVLFLGTVRISKS